LIETVVLRVISRENTKKHLVRVEGKLHVIAHSVHPYTLLYCIVEDYSAV